MTCIEKFTFSRSFGDDLLRHRGEPGSLVVMHSDEEIARVRAEALAEGRAEGYAAGLAAGRAQAEAEAAAALDRHETKVLERLAERLAETVAVRDDVARTAERGALMFAATTLRKALPAFHRRLGEVEIEALLADIAGRMAEQITLTVAVHPELAASLQVRLETMAARCRLTGRLFVAAEAGIAEGDCRIAWAGGGAERHLSALMARIEDIVRTVAGNETDLADAETSGSIEHHG